MEREKCIHEIVESLRQTQRSACGRLAKVPGVSVTPSQWALLNLIYDKKGISTKELSEMMHVSKSAVTQLANDLEKKGYLSRTSDPKDKRTINIVPTPKCNRMMSSIQKSFAARFALMFNKLSDSQLRTLNDLHKKIATHASIS